MCFIWLRLYRLDSPIFVSQVFITLWLLFRSLKRYLFRFTFNSLRYPHIGRKNTPFSTTIAYFEAKQTPIFKQNRFSFVMRDKIPFCESDNNCTKRDSFLCTSYFFYYVWLNSNPNENKYMQNFTLFQFFTDWKCPLFPGGGGGGYELFDEEAVH